jgi:hypothetical protein
MKRFRADLHIHTVLSPCGDLEMSPQNIINQSVKNNLAIIGITDHNTTKQAKLVRELASRYGIFVLTGAEVTTKEEIHCLTFFENDDQLDDFQSYIEENLIKIPNNPDKFGYQVVVDEQEQITEQIDYLLLTSLTQSISQVTDKVHSLNGIIIAAHIDRPSYSILSQLGFIPDDLEIDGVEVSAKCNIGNIAELRINPKLTVVSNSDAHYPEDIGKSATTFEIEECTFNEIKMALKSMNSRKTVLL